MSEPRIITPQIQDFSEDNIQTLMENMPWMKDRQFKMTESLEELRSFVDEAIQAGKCVIDFETTGLSTRTKKIIKDGQVIQVPVEKIVGVGLCYDPKYGLYTPINHQEDAELNLPEKEVLEELRRLCANCVTIYHNAKFDIAQLKIRGIEIEDYKKIEDTQILARLYDAGQKELKLKILSERFLNQPMLKFSDIVQTANRFDVVSPRIGYRYGASDAICTMDLYNFFSQSDIIKRQQLIYDIERLIVLVVIEMESNLVKIDVPYLKSIKEKTENRIKEIEREIFTLAGHEFNLGSPQQLVKVLYEELKLKCESTTEKGKNSTDNAALKKLALVQPICKKIIAYRSLEKSLNTYINNLLSNYDEDECIKLGFHQSGTDTGRFSSPGGIGLKEDGYCGVNVQSIPKTTKDPDSEEELPDIRRAFIARPGKTIVAADYENEEMRVAANISNETAWINAVNNGIDFHTATGAMITGKPLSEVTPDERKLAKSVNFLSLYLGGARTLAANVGISEMEAKRILNTFFAGVPRLRKWIDQEIKKARKTKTVKTLLGRIRPLSGYYDSGDKSLENHADRCVINTQIQGTCADIMKIVMSKIYTWIHKNNLQDDVKILITMHDELVFEITTEKLGILVPEIVKIMMLPEVIRDLFHWPLPLTVDVKYGESWRVKKKFFEDFPEAKKKLSEPLIDFNTIPSVSSSDSDKAPSSVPEPQKPDLPINKAPVSAEPISKEEPKATSESEEFIYTLRDTGDVTLLHLNNILNFILRENKRAPDKYKGERKILRIRDKDGYSLLVSEYKVPVDVFLAFARFFKI